MNKKDVIELYKQGYSVSYIIDLYYSEKTKFDIPNHRYNSVYIIPDKSIVKTQAREEVESSILNYLKTS